MADPLRFGYGTGQGDGNGRLDASGPRDVVFCHQCEHEWYQDEACLICPRCEGEITEIITPESDPRPVQHPRSPPEDLHNLRDHNPWAGAEADSDPEEADIEEHITHGPNGSVFVSRTIRSSMPRSRRNQHPRGPPDDPHDVMQDFQSMLTSLMGPGFRQGRPGRSGQDEMFGGPPFAGNTFRLGGGPNGGPSVVGGRFTITTGPGLRPRNANGPQTGDPQVDDITNIIENLFGQMGPTPGDDRPGGGPGFLQALFSTMVNPANARHGDAVYTQEALDQIISTLMEQHPTSNAPGPASADAIAALPKIKLDEKKLGPEGKGECSVCMDDVHLGDEVVHLPCTHWFHEACASAWLSEHNTCPICRKGIESSTTQTPTPSSGNTNHQSQRYPSPNPPPYHQHQHRPTNAFEQSNPRSSNLSLRNETRLNTIRNTGGMSYDIPDRTSRRYQVIGEPQSQSQSQSQYQTQSQSQPQARGDENGSGEDYARMPGSFSRRDSERSGSSLSLNQNQERRRDSRRGSGSTSGASASGTGTGTGTLSWLRDRFSRHD